MSAIADDRKSDMPEAPPPQAFGRYEVLFPIARGGMAEVFACRIRGEGAFERHFAIKRMAPELIRHDKFVQSFLDEARLTACIHSPNVVQVVDIGRDERGAPYLVMELIQGVSLSALKKRVPQPMSLGVICEVGAQAAAGLEDAHTATDARGAPLGVVHRDVSPQNVLVAIDGRVRIADFGIARAKQRLASNTQSGELKGKFGYFAPEQLRGGADPRTDVFALGVVLWELIAGRPLFHRSEVLDTIMNVERLEIPRLDALRPEVATEVADVIARALQRDANDRFQSAGQMSVTFRRLIDRGVVGPPPETELRALARSATAPLLETLQRTSSGEHSLDPIRASMASTAVAGARDTIEVDPGGRPSLRTSQVPTDQNVMIEVEAPVSDVRERESAQPTSPRLFSPSHRPIPATIGPNEGLLDASRAPTLVTHGPNQAVLTPFAPPIVQAREPETTDRLAPIGAPGRSRATWALVVALGGCGVIAMVAIVLWRMSRPSIGPDAPLDRGLPEVIAPPPEPTAPTHADLPHGVWPPPDPVAPAPLEPTAVVDPPTAEEPQRTESDHHHRPRGTGVSVPTDAPEPPAEASRPEAHVSAPTPAPPTPVAPPTTAPAPPTTQVGPAASPTGSPRLRGVDEYDGVHP